MLTLYYSPGACSTASHILLEETGAEYETQQVLLAKGEQRREAYRKINPHGKVPALAIDGAVITQNAAILPYIAGRFPEAGLAPADPVEFARCMETVGWLTSAVHPAFALALHPERPTGGADASEATIEAIRQNGRGIFWGCLEEIDARLAGKRWMMGERYSFVDPYTLVFYGWGNRIGMEMSRLENFTGFKNRMMERPAVRRVLEREQSPLLDAA